jgi:hypothetical protein
MSKIVIEKYRITGLDNGYLIEFEAEEEIGKFCCKTRDEVKEFVYEYWLDEVDACGCVEVEAKIKICE